MNAIAQASAAPVSGPELDNRRVAAAIVDLFIVAAGAAVVLFAGDALAGDRGGVRGALGFVILGWALYYFFATESGQGQTIGKRLMKLRVVRADGRPAGMAEIAVRTILRVVDNYLVGLIAMLATGEKRQRIGDLAAGTIVVDASAATIAPPAPVANAVEEAEHDEPAADAQDSEPVAPQTITLPARAAKPATVADLAAAAVEVEPVAEDEPVVEAEPVAEAPVVEAPEAELPSVVSPSLEELAQDVAAGRAEPEVELADPVDDEPVAAEPEVDEAQAGEMASADAPEASADEAPVTVKSVETVSAMDLIMGAADEHASEGSLETDQHSDEPAAG